MRKLLTISVAATVLVGCVHQPPTDVEGIPASAVIDLVKAQLAQAGAVSETISASGSACALKDSVTVAAVPASVTVALKAAATLQDSGTLGLTIPVSSVTVGPSLALTDTHVDTQTVTYDLAVVHSPKTETDLTAELKSLRDKIDLYSNELSDRKNGLPLTEAQVRFIDSQIKETRSKINTDEAMLVGLQQQRASTEPAGFAALSLQPPTIPSLTTKKLNGDMSIADAIKAAARELLAVNHTRLPCLKPQDVKVEIDFDVQKKVDGTVKLSVLFLQFGVERAQTNESFHSMLVNFDLSQGSSQLLYVQ